MAPLPLTGVALVTDAASGIGAATVRAFVRSGVTRLALADVQADKLEAIKAEFANNDEPVEVETFVCNVAEEEDVRTMVSGCVSKFGRVDYAVNCAGITGAHGYTHNQSMADWDKVVGVNQRGVFLCVREQLKAMVEQEPLGNDDDARRHSRGSIVNIASIAGLVGCPGLPGYVASKHAVVGLAKAICIEYGGQGIRCNNIAPGHIDTPMTQNATVAAAVDKTPPIPMQRAGRPEEIADVAIFLSSEGASYVNGATWPVDGGYTSL